MSSSKAITLSSRVNYLSINDRVKLASYAVRGPIVTKSMEIGKQLKTGKHNYPYNEILSCNIVRYSFYV